MANTVTIPVQAFYDHPIASFNINVAYTKETNIKTLEDEVNDYLQKKYNPKQLKIGLIYAASFMDLNGDLYYENGEIEEYNELMNKAITDYDKNKITEKGLMVRVFVKYEHKIFNEPISCKFMINEKSTDPIKCPIYKEMIKDSKFNQQNLNHIENEIHFENEMEEKPECKFNDNCDSFKKLENGGNKIEDLSHCKMYRHPPRKRNIKLQQNVKAMMYNKTLQENNPVYYPKEDDKKKYSYNLKDGYLNGLIQEVINNGFKSDLCFICNKDDECKHDEYDILQLVDQKMKHQRHLMMDSPLNRDEMLSLLLYTGCECNYDLCKSQRNGDHTKWKWFDYCLYNAINKIAQREMGSFSVFTGLSGVQLDKKEVKEAYFVTYTSTSSAEWVATSFMGNNKGMLIKMDKKFKNNLTIQCCDVSWISKFPDEQEILFARSTHSIDAFKCKVINNQSHIQTVMLYHKD